MTLFTSRITAGTTIIPLTGLVSNPALRTSILVANLGDSTVYVGDSSVTINNGYPVYPGEIWPQHMDDGLNGAQAHGTILTITNESLFVVASQDVQISILEAS